MLSKCLADTKDNYRLRRINVMLPSARGVKREKNILCPLCCLHYSTIYVKYKSSLKIVSRVTNTITLPPRLAVLRYSFWSSRDSRL